MTKIKWEQSTVREGVYRTQRFGNLLSDTIQGEVDRGDDGTWNGWLFNWSNSTRNEFRLGFASKRAAVRWVNGKLKGWGAS